jgi:hypothetical protein
MKLMFYVLQYIMTVWVGLFELPVQIHERMRPRKHYFSCLS